MPQYDDFADEYMEMRTDMFRKGENSEFPVMLDLLGDIEGKSLLDLGCGFGEYAKTYSKLGAKLICIDSSKKEIDFARKQNISNCEFLVHDITQPLPFKDQGFDFVTSSLLFSHIEDLNRVFKECSRLLKKGGMMVFSIANPVLFQEKSLAGKMKLEGKKIVFGNYFQKRKIKRVWGGKIAVEHYHKPLEDYFSAILNNGFEILSFKEPKPAPNITHWHSKNPVFLVFKIRKK